MRSYQWLGDSVVYSKSEIQFSNQFNFNEKFKYKIIYKNLQKHHKSLTKNISRMPVFCCDQLIFDYQCSV